MISSRIRLSPFAYLLALALAGLAACSNISPESPPLQTPLEVRPADLSSNVGEGVFFDLTFDPPRAVSDNSEIVDLLNRSITLHDEQNGAVELVPITELEITGDRRLAARIQPVSSLSPEWHTLLLSEELANHFRVSGTRRNSLAARVHPGPAPVVVMALIEGSVQRTLNLRFSEPVGPLAGRSMNDLISVVGPENDPISCVAPQGENEGSGSVFRRTWTLECENAPSGMLVKGSSEIVNSEGFPVRLFSSNEAGFEVELRSDVTGTPFWTQL